MVMIVKCSCKISRSEVKANYAKFVWEPDLLPEDCICSYDMLKELCHFGSLECHERSWLGLKWIKYSKLMDYRLT